MKQTFFLALSTLLLFVFSCRSPSVDPSDSLPDLIVELEIEENGSVIESMSFTYPEQQPGDGETAASNGSYLELSNLFSMQVNGNPGAIGPILGIQATLASLSTGTYQVQPLDSSNPLANPHATYRTASGDAFAATSGSFKITKADLFVAGGAILADTYFIDLEIDMTLATADGSRSITVKGRLEGVTIGVQ